MRDWMSVFEWSAGSMVTYSHRLPYLSSQEWVRKGKGHCYDMKLNSCKRFGAPGGGMVTGLPAEPFFNPEP